MKGLRYCLGVLTVAHILTACTTEAWYEGVRRGAENDCRKQPGTAAEDCLARLNKAPYSEYSKEREAAR